SPHDALPIYPEPNWNERGLYSMPGAWVKLHGFEGERAQANRKIKLIEQEPPSQKSPMEIELADLRRYNELIFRFLPIGLVVIDHNYRILTANGAGRRLLAFRDLAHDQDFLHTVRGLPYAKVRAAIDSVFREGSPETLAELAVEVIKSSGERYLTLNIAPMQLEAGQADLT